MEQIKEAIESAYTSQIKDTYKNFTQAMLIAGGDEQDVAEAEARFKKGLNFAARTRARALELLDD